VNVLRRNVVRDINDLRVWISRKDYSFHRAHEVILRTEIS
jgi:hypothetical protein